MNSRDDAENTDSISSTVVEAVAAAADVDPLALDPPLTRVVDGDALDALAGDGTITFEYHGHDVVVRPDRTVEVDGTVYDEGESAPER